MPFYTFFLHEDADATPRFELELFDNQVAAGAHARRILDERAYYAAVTVALDNAEILRVERQAAG